MPIIVGADDVVFVSGLPGETTMPDILQGITVSDNFTEPGKITLAQSPIVGTVLTDAVTIATITATDEAGNVATQQVAITCKPYPPLNLRFLAAGLVRTSTGAQ